MLFHPSDYNLSARSPEAYTAIAVEDYVHTVGKEKLHAEGIPSKGFLCSYIESACKFIYTDYSVVYFLF